MSANSERQNARFIFPEVVKSHSFRYQLPFAFYFTRPPFKRKQATTFPRSYSPLERVVKKKLSSLKICVCFFFPSGHTNAQPAHRHTPPATGLSAQTLSRGPPRSRIIITKAGWQRRLFVRSKQQTEFQDEESMALGLPEKRELNHVWETEAVYRSSHGPSGPGGTLGPQARSPSHSLTRPYLPYPSHTSTLRLLSHLQSRI